MYTVIGSGIDSLVIGFNVAGYRDPESFKILEQAKEEASEKLFGGKGTGIDWYGKPFVVHARGAKGYEWVLENADVSICIARKPENGRIYPELYVTFRAEYLWSFNERNVVYDLKHWLSTWAIITGDKVSRCDLCIDLQMDMPQINLANDVVTRAKGKTEYYGSLPAEHYVNGKRDTGYRFGQGAIISRIYDKSLEVVISQKEWFQTLWSAHGWDGVSAVTRVEFQCRRDFLKEMSVDDFWSLTERISDIWRYCVQDWLTIRTPGNDSHRHRWKIKDWWNVIEEGYSFFGELYGVLRYKQKKCKYDHLMRQARGVLLTAAALCCVSTGTIYATSQVNQETAQWFNSDEFKVEVQNRMIEVGGMNNEKLPKLVEDVIKFGGELIIAY
ncbi:hypothetical protein B1772_00295 [Dehalococcoides mccartyi]|jgi:hypothetical protein|uniref:hypothetical protein n=1 Tax=Dehalococcoides mccartyi TaxID=61435 RepID=UPI00099C82D4|nr:hypothetical protein [Dehalococcoides mccartyi]AQX74031.1 hypothetical protein B1776_00305 [Dehalococcoides mccartyi]AQY72544.1 hypothetical protein B1772_00295 [Dehalococcoides mccartyi]